MLHKVDHPGLFTRYCVLRGAFCAKLSKANCPSLFFMVWMSVRLQFSPGAQASAEDNTFPPQTGDYPSCVLQMVLCDIQTWWKSPTNGASNFWLVWNWTGIDQRSFVRNDRSTITRWIYYSLRCSGGQKRFFSSLIWRQGHTYHMPSATRHALSSLVNQFQRRPK